MNHDQTGKQHRVAMDEDGHALAVWSRSYGLNFNLLAREYALDSGWSLAKHVETGTQAVTSESQVLKMKQAKHSPGGS